MPLSYLCGNSVKKGVPIAYMCIKYIETVMELKIGLLSKHQGLGNFSSYRPSM